MLLQVAVTNYRSFKDTTVLSLVPAPHVQHRPGQTAETGLAGCPDVLRAAVIYGPNGAGKSNFLKAIVELRKTVFHGDLFRARPFRLNGDDPRSTIEVDFVVDQRHYAYGLRTSTRVVEEEWLVESGEGLDREIFHRVRGTPWWDALNVAADIFPAAGALARNIPDEVVFAYLCGEAGLGELASVQRWFAGRLWPASVFDSFSHVWLLEDASARAHAEALLGRAGVGAVRIGFAVDAVADPDARERLASKGIPQALPLSAERYADVAQEVDVTVSLRLFHLSQKGVTVPFTLDEESDGTARLLDLASWHHAVGSHSTAVGLVDEIERSLHPLVVRELFDPLVNAPGGGQLVATTHDANLLDLKLLPPDSVWFAQKGPDGATRLYSLAEFDPAQLEALSSHLEEGYLAGRFGAIPFVGDSARLGWRKP